MKIICLILARSGSQRLKNKNKKKIMGSSLIERTVQFAEKSGLYSEIYISTDDVSIVNAYKNRILVPWIRPKKYAMAKSSSEVSILHFLKWYKKKLSKKSTCFMLLQPTSPFRKILSFKRAIKKFKNNGYINSIVGVSPNKYNYKNSDIILINNKKFFVNGSLYMTTIDNFLKKKTFFNLGTSFHIQKSIQESIDIDTHTDLLKARKLAKLNVIF